MADKTYLDQQNERAELRGYDTPSNDDWAAHFALHGPERRIEILQNIDRDMEAGSGSLRKIAKEWSTLRELRHTHDQLIKAGR